RSPRSPSSTTPDPAEISSRSIRAARRPSVSPESVASRPTRESSCCVAPAARGLTLHAPARSARLDRARFPLVGALDDWRFCPRCSEAIAKEDGHAVCPACGYRAYANPVPGTEAVVTDNEGRVL